MNEGLEATKLSDGSCRLAVSDYAGSIDNPSQYASVYLTAEQMRTLIEWWASDETELELEAAR